MQEHCRTTHTSNQLVAALCAILSIATASLSAILTTQFMFGIGSEMGTPYLMASLGLLLDIAKCIAPLFVVFLWLHNLKIVAVATAVLAASLSLVSFAASVAALEAGVENSNKHSVSYQRIESQINDYREQVTQLRLLAVQQQAAKQITRSQQTLNQVPNLLSRIDELASEQAAFSTGGSVVAQYGMVVSIVAAAALELLSWVFVFVNHALNKAKHSRSHSSTIVHTDPFFSVSEPVSSELHTQPLAQSFTVSTHLNALNDERFDVDCVLEFNDGDTIEKVKCDSQLYIDIRDAILAKEVKPSFRGVSMRFKGVGRNLISTVLTDLHETGFLKTYRNGYAFA